MENTPPTLADCLASLRRAALADARAARMRLSGAVEALLFTLIAHLIGRLLRSLAAAQPSPVAPLPRHVPAATAVREESLGSAAIPRALRRGSRDIIIAMAHAMPRPNRSRPARMPPVRPRAARDPPPGHAWKNPGPPRACANSARRRSRSHAR